MNVQTEINLLVTEQRHILLNKLDKVSELNTATNSILDLHKRIGFQLKIAHHLLQIESMIAHTVRISARNHQLSCGKKRSIVYCCPTKVLLKTCFRKFLTLHFVELLRSSLIYCKRLLLSIQQSQFEGFPAGLNGSYFV